MKKILLSLTLFTHLSFAATPEQVEQYLLVSRAEEELIALESQFSAMQNSFTTKGNDEINQDVYDMQMLSLRFKEYIQKHLSENEMTEVLDNYKNIILLQFRSSSSEAQDHDSNETFSYVEKLKTTPESSERISLVEEISKELYSKEAMIIMFDELMKPLMKNGIGGEKINEKMLTSIREDYLKRMTETSKNETLYASKDFTIEELEELLTIAQTTAVDHETKAVFGAMAYALKEFFITLSSRFDVSKHQPKTITDTNNSK